MPDRVPDADGVPGKNAQAKADFHHHLDASEAQKLSPKVHAKCMHAAARAKRIMLRRLGRLVPSGAGGTSSSSAASREAQQGQPTMSAERQVEECLGNVELCKCPGEFKVSSVTDIRHTLILT